MSPLILASTSRYRAELLQRLRIPFQQAAPDVDETPLPRESAQRLAARLALAKARAISMRFPDAWVLGSDQAAACEGKLLGKPGDRAATCEQLASLSGRYAMFATGVVLLNGSANKVLRGLDVTVVKLRKLRPADIDRYVDAEPAFDCAGGFKMEGLGITLFKEIQSSDPTGLIGLPLIATARLLRKAGYILS